MLVLQRGSFNNDIFSAVHMALFSIFINLNVKVYTLIPALYIMKRTRFRRRRNNTVKKRRFNGGSQKLLKYMEENTKNGYKIMLIVGAVPEQISKFIIPDGYVPVFIEDDNTFSTYSERIPTAAATEDNDFSSYPLIIGHAPYGLPKHAFDLVVFDNSVIKFNPLTKSLINEYRALLRNEQSLLVLDNIYKSHTMPFNIYLRENSNREINIDVMPLDLLKSTPTQKPPPIIHINTATKLLEYTTQMYLNGTKLLDGVGLMHILAINLWEMFGEPVAEFTCPSLLETPPRMAICLSNIFHSGAPVNLPYIYVGGNN